MKLGVIFDPMDTVKFMELKTFPSLNMHEFINLLSLKEEVNKTDDEILKEKFKSVLSSCDIFIFLIGKNSKKRVKFLLWQQAIALELQKPIVVLNLNFLRSVDYDRTPQALTKNLSLHCAFHEPIVNYAVNVFPRFFYEQKEIGKTKPKYLKKTYRVFQDVYEKYQIYTSDLG